MWAMTAVVFVFLVLRLCTRVFVVRSVGGDDHMYFWSWVFLFLHNLFIHIAAGYGFGQDQSTLSLDDGATAHKWEMIGQTFIIVGMGMSKMSLALFLLRIVIERWHRISIWAVGGSLMFASSLTGILCWLQCLPAQRIYDKRVEGRCIIDPVPWAILLGSFCIFVDFFFAIFPWVFLHKLEMKKKEKMVVGISLSFGIIAGICGIVRTANLEGLGSSNYTGETVKLVIWTAAEMSVTLICIAVPTIIPLYLKITRATLSTNKSASSGRYQKHSQGTDESRELQRIKPPAGMELQKTAHERTLGVNGPFNEVNIGYTSDGNNSDEAILHVGQDGDQQQRRIVVTEEVTVSRSKSVTRH
ncbi:hypothetical protein F5X68DRAFT_242188 [Plectosphaerella plurivora]|uniref:Rhodopsin domain-containing protein n=1 Tax=Plectosphaerella plurivora TaxID=936078 RepID=A0A9P8V756_9PEZI|nr:hypothetical protein F5X68DRAFT_242188 [Plectosphaerella plurivora]